MFYITSDDIASLETDALLRELVRRLCEAELRSRGLSASAVTAGGHQDAADGGIDVRVRLEPSEKIEGFIPRFSTGYQVKKQDMPAGQIDAEMRPKGAIRPSIQKLADEGGAYIIVSSEGSVADEPLERRMAAMKAAVDGVPNANALRIDFYDRTRIASWAGEHASARLWIKTAIGRAVPGWEPFSAWANPSDGIEGEYIIDEGLRVVRRPGEEIDSELSVTDGLTTLRNVLQEEKTSVRLVGLSGLGKTRLVQALFDARIGKDALDPTLAVYTNLSNRPTPQPYGLVSDLVETGTRNIVLIDNCPPELHAQLTEIVQKNSSRVSLLTVEYDIRDDQPDNTAVFELKPSSDELIEKLLQKRYPELSQVNARTVAQFAGGNARVALALADTIGKSGTAANLTNDQLFQRLFLQRHPHDKPLQVMAEACSLLYSFNGEDLASSGELAILGTLVGATPSQMFAAVSELLERNLAQRRGAWRAILPHAIANRLAEAALRKLPPQAIEEVVNAAGARTLRSFSRRLGFLHDSREAKAIVGKWLSQDGICGNVLALEGEQQTIFSNIIAADSNAALAAIERSIEAAEGTITSGRFLILAIRALAYDAALFERAVRLLKVLSTAGDEVTRKEAADAHGSLFTMYLSGTYASAAQRSSVVRALLQSAVEQERLLGLKALDQMLEGFHFMSGYDFSFGGRSRDYGLHPKTYDDVKEWYGTAIGVVKEFLGSPLEDDVKGCLANNFRGVWQRGWLWDELEAVFTEIGSGGFWSDGWRAIRETQKYGAGGAETDSYRHLAALEAVLRPNGLIETIRGSVFVKKGGGYDDEDFEDDENDYQQASERRAQRVALLGERLVREPSALNLLLPEIVTQSGLTHVLAIGLARGSNDLSADWKKLVAEYAAAPAKARTQNALQGFLGEVGRQNPNLANAWLDDAVTSDALAETFVALQTSVDLGTRASQRLLRALEFGKAPLWSFENLAFGRVTDQIAADELAQILLAIVVRGGHESAAHILYMRFAGDRDAAREYAEELKAVGRMILEEFDLGAHTRQRDHYFADIARRCLPGEAGASATEKLCLRLRAAVMARDISIYDLRDLLERVFEAQPNVALDTFFGGEPSEIARAISAIEYLSDGRRPTPLGKVTDDTLTDWCDLDAEARYPIIAATGMIFTFDNNGTVTGWAPLADSLIHKSPDPIAVVRTFSGRLRPTGFVGSYASILEHGAKLLDGLNLRGNQELTEFVRERTAQIIEDAARIRKSEEEEHRQRDETFE